MLFNQTPNELEAYQARQRLLGQLQTENQQIMQAIEKFYAQKSRNESGALQTLQEIIIALDRLLADESWQTSQFLRNSLKPLVNLREQTFELREQLLGKTKAEVVAPPVLAPEMVKVYIAIFQNKAHHYKDWESQLRALPQYVLGRPIYRDESAVQTIIRSKLLQTFDAYVCVGVPIHLIQKGEFHPSQIDKHGNELVQLVPGAIKTENILEFVYQNGHYYFVDGKLVETHLSHISR